MENEKKTIGIVVGVIVLPLLIVAVLLGALGWLLIQESTLADVTPEINTTPSSAQTQAEIESFSDSFRWEIVDKRTDKVPLNGKYLLDYESSYGPNDWLESFWLELFDDYILVGKALIDHEGIVEIDQHEGLTWLCFLDSADRWGNNSLYFYLYTPGVIIKGTSHDDLFNVHSNDYSLVYKRDDLIFEEMHGQEANENNMALLDFDPTSFYLDKTIGEIYSVFPDVHCCYYESGSLVYHSEEADKYFRIAAGVKDPDNPPDEMEIYGFGSSAKKIFPNMGTWVFKEEVRNITDYCFEGLNELFFEYQGYSFSCTYEDSFDITPNTKVMVRKTWSEDE